jgi:hypothetical protein
MPMETTTESEGEEDGAGDANKNATSPEEDAVDAASDGDEEIGECEELKEEQEQEQEESGEEWTIEDMDRMEGVSTCPSVLFTLPHHPSSH